MLEAPTNDLFHQGWVEGIRLGCELLRDLVGRHGSSRLGQLDQEAPPDDLFGLNQASGEEGGDGRGLLQPHVEGLVTRVLLREAVGVGVDLGRITRCRQAGDLGPAELPAGEEATMPFDDVVLGRIGRSRADEQRHEQTDLLNAPAQALDALDAAFGVVLRGDERVDRKILDDSGLGLRHSDIPSG